VSHAGTRTPLHVGLSERKRQPKFAVLQKGISPQIGFDRSALADEAVARRGAWPLVN